MLVRWANLISGALLVAVVLGFLIFFPENLTDYEREPEDVWLGLWWMGAAALVAALCFVNARYARADTLNPARWWLAICNALVVGGAISLLLTDSDPALLPLMIPFILGPAVALAFS